MLLEEFLKPLGLSQVDFAARLGVSFPRLNEIIKKRRGVTPDTALRLGRVLGMSADFWLGLQLHWDLWNAMQSVDYLKIQRLKTLKELALEARVQKKSLKKEAKKPLVELYQSVSRSY
jgi:addiction module HigA family antidote